MSEPSRYARQTLFGPIGDAGQERLRAACAVVVGCGALGSVASQQLVRAGVGRVRIIDRDVPDLTNLQRQVLFDEDDVATGVPKAEAARRKLARVNSEVTVDACVEDLVADGAERLLCGADVVLDGTDNFATRLLVNDWAVKTATPWVYCGVIGAQVHSLAILPGETACFRCYVGDVPPAGSVATCETAGVLGPTVEIGASYAVVEALKVLLGRRDEVERKLLVLDVWTRQQRAVGVPRDPACPCCGKGDLEFLRGEREAGTARLCGRDAVQIAAPGGGGARIDLAALERDLAAHASALSRNAFLLRASVEDVEISVFGDGRAIVKGTRDPARARTLYARYIGT